MPRTIPADRFEQLIAAATDVFLEQGYRRTQMADVAERLGVAKGTLYLYVESKAALLHCVLASADRAHPLALPARLPVPTPRPGATLAMLRRRIRERAQLPALEAALARRRVPDLRTEVEEIAGEIFDLLARNADSITLLDRCAADYPELARAWYGTGRDGITRAFANYLRARVRRRRMTPVVDADITARMLLEVLATWAVHRRHDAIPLEASDDRIRNSAVALVTRSLAPH